MKSDTDSHIVSQSVTKGPVKWAKPMGGYAPKFEPRIDPRNLKVLQLVCFLYNSLLLLFYLYFNLVVILYRKVTWTSKRPSIAYATQLVTLDGNFYYYCSIIIIIIIITTSSSLSPYFLSMFSSFPISFLIFSRVLVGYVNDKTVKLQSYGTGMACTLLLTPKQFTNINKIGGIPELEKHLKDNEVQYAIVRTSLDADGARKTRGTVYFALN